VSSWISRRLALTTGPVPLMRPRSRGAVRSLLLWPRPPLWGGQVGSGRAEDACRGRCGAELGESPARRSQIRPFRAGSRPGRLAPAQRRRRPAPSRRQQHQGTSCSASARTSASRGSLGCCSGSGSVVADHGSGPAATTIVAAGARLVGLVCLGVVEVRAQWLLRGDDVDVGQPEPWHPIAADHHQSIGDQHGGEPGGGTAGAMTAAPWHRDMQASAPASGEHVRHDKHPTQDKYPVDLFRRFAFRTGRAHSSP
jgi:hypothetical protein